MLASGRRITNLGTRPLHEGLRQNEVRALQKADFMQAIKTKARVNEKGQLNLLDHPFGLEQGNIVEVIMLFSNPKIPKADWQSVLAKIGTHTEEDLAGFAEIKKEFDRRQPITFYRKRNMPRPSVSI